MNIKKSSHRDIKSTRPSETSLLSVQRRPIYLVADNIRSLHNIGSIFRTAEAAGIEKLYLTGISGKPPRKEISKTVIGAENNVPWEYHPDILPVFAFFRSQHIPVIALEHTQASTPFQEAEYCFPLCLIVGNEVDGIPEETLAYCDAAVEIPMFGMKQSLNVAVATGIMLYEFLRRLGHAEK